MSSIDSLHVALADRVAAGWIAMGGQLEGSPESSVVDIEALVTATARLGDLLDSRTRGVALDWSVRYGDAVNSVRLHRVAAEMDGLPATAGFAALVAASGGPHWPIAAGASAPGEVRDRVLVRDLKGDARLAWRLRAAFGVSARADILAALLLTDEARSISELARRTRFAKRSVAVAVEALALAGLVEVERVGREDRVRLAPDAPVRAWRPAVRPSPAVDWVARWQTGIEVISVLAATEAATPAVAAVERRVSADALRSAVVAGDLPRIDTTVTGVLFAREYERWSNLLARTFAGSQ